MKTKRVLILIPFLFLIKVAFSQDTLYNGFCSFQPPSMQIPNINYSLTEGCISTNGFAHSPKGNLHIMYIIVDFIGAQPDAESSWWPENGIPNYAALSGSPNDLLDISTTIPTNRNNLSTWYRIMSGNNFTITGEVFKVTINQSSFFSTMTNDAFAALQNQYPNRDWSVFDQRQNNPNWSYNNSIYKSDQSPAGGDGLLDFVFMQFRTNNTGANQAALWNNSSLTTTFGTGAVYKADAGATLANFFQKPNLMEYFTHEFAHNLYLSPHYMGANNLSGLYFYQNRGWGMMSYQAIMHTSNAWEKWLLGWIDMSTKTITSNSSSVILKDFVTQNDAIRIPIPGTNPTQYLWIENHQKLHFLDEKLFIHPESTMGKGIYAFVSGNGNDCDNDKTFVFDWINSTTTNMFKVLSAKGNHDFIYTSSGTGPNTFTKLAGNPISGQTCLTPIRADFGNVSNVIDYCLDANNHNSGPDDQEAILSENGIMTYSSLGTPEDAFQVGDEISISGILPALNYPQYDNGIQPYFINGLSIKIISYNATNGEYTLDIQFNNFDLNNDKRWAGGTICLNDLSDDNNPDLIIKSGKTLTINKSGTPNVNVKTIYSDFEKPTEYVCKNGSFMKLDANSKVIVDVGSVFKMEANSKLEINDGAELRIRGNSNLQLEENSVLVIKEGGKVIIENTGVLLYNGNAAITLTDANSVIEMENGGKIKINANTTFSYTGNGYLLVEDNWPYKTNIIAGGPNAKFSVDGINKRKVMEVIGNEALYPSDDLSLFEIKNAKVILNAGTRIIAGCPISLYNVDILPNPNFPSLKHRGLHLFGQKTDLSVLKVVGGIKGVTAYNNVFGNELNILAFTANECDQGLWVNDKGVNIISGTFKNNVNQGMFLNAQSLPSELSSITAKFNLSGADIIGNKGAIARFFYPDIQYNGSGIYADNSTISANCGNIKNSNNYNVYLRNNSLLDLDPAQILGAGLIDFSSTGQYSTPYLIRLDKAAHGPYLNNAKSNFTSGSWRIWGDLRDISSLVSFLYYNVNVNQNFWTTPTGVTLPIFNSHYRVKYIERSFPFSNPAIRDLLYIDNTPLSTAPNTTNCNPFNGTTMSVTYGVSTKYTQDGRNLNDILKSGLDRIYGIQPNIPGAVHDFNDILQTTFTANELNEWTVPILYTFDKLYEAIARGLKDSTYWVKNQDGSNHAIFTSTIDLYDIWINNFNSNAPVGYTLKLNKALFNRLFNNRTECLNQLNCLTNIVDSMDMALLEYYQCVVDKEIKMSNGLLDREIYNTFDECIAMLNIPSNRTIPNEEYLGKRNSKGMQEQVAPISPLLIFNLFPNPATNQLYIAFNSSGYGNFTLEIFDILGNKKITINKPSEKDNHFAIEIDNLSAGAYFIKTSVDGLIRLDKFIVAK